MPTLSRIRLSFKSDFEPPDKWHKEPDGLYSASVAPGEAMSLLNEVSEVTRSVHVVESGHQSLDELFVQLTANEEVPA